jgi:hypothetical protein
VFDSARKVTKFARSIVLRAMRILLIAKGDRDMQHISSIDLGAAHYVLCFTDLFVSGRGYAFPCDAEGHVDVNHLSIHSRNNYLHARAVVGRDLAAPIVTRLGPIAASTARRTWN